MLIDPIPIGRAIFAAIDEAEEDNSILSRSRSPIRSDPTPWEPARPTAPVVIGIELAPLAYSSSSEEIDPVVMRERGPVGMNRPLPEPELVAGPALGAPTALLPEAGGGRTGGPPDIKARGPFGGSKVAVPAPLDTLVGPTFPPLLL